LFPAGAAPRAAANAPFKLALPAADKGVIYALDVTLKLPAGVHISGMTGQPFQVGVTNQASLPSYIRAAASIYKTSSPTKFTVYVAINAPKGKVPFRRLAGDTKLDGNISVPPPFTGATVKQEPGDKCSDFKAKAHAALADVTMIGSSPTEGPDIEKHTEGADPNCKKPTTTTVATEPGHCDATPVPKDCRYDLAVDVEAPERVDVTVVARIKATLTVTNVGAARSPSAYVEINAGDSLIDAGPCGEERVFKYCHFGALATGEKRVFDIELTPINLEQIRKTHGRLVIHFGGTAGTEHDANGIRCDNAGEARCNNNRGDVAIVVASPK
jgi:hypothetical protein